MTSILLRQARFWTQLSMFGRMIAVAAAAAFLILAACSVSAQKCNVQGECVGTVIASVQV